MTLIRAAAAALLLLVAVPALAQDDDLSPYGSSKSDMHEYPTINAVFDVNFEDPAGLRQLYAYVNNTADPLKGKMVVVTHGPEIRAFAKENYVKYQSVMDKMKELADKGVEFRMCGNAVRAAGYKPDDFHGFVTVVPAGIPEIALLQSQGYAYINPIPISPKDVRYLDHPEKRTSDKPQG